MKKVIFGILGPNGSGKSPPGNSVNVRNRQQYFAWFGVLFLTHAFKDKWGHYWNAQFPNPYEDFKILIGL